MNTQNQAYKVGDIVVHNNYGVGTIILIENKPLNGGNIECFKVETKNGSFWFPTAAADNPRIKHVASKDVLQKAKQILSTAPEALETAPEFWKERIEDIRAEGKFLEICTLLRDLTILKTIKKLNRTQEQALNSLEDRLTREWAGSLKMPTNSIRPKIQAYLEKSKSKYVNAPNPEDSTQNE